MGKHLGNTPSPTRARCQHVTRATPHGEGACGGVRSRDGNSQNTTRIESNRHRRRLTANTLLSRSPTRPPLVCFARQPGPCQDRGEDTRPSLGRTGPGACTVCSAKGRVPPPLPRSVARVERVAPSLALVLVVRAPRLLPHLFAAGFPGLRALFLLAAVGGFAGLGLRQ